MINRWHKFNRTLNKSFLILSAVAIGIMFFATLFTQPPQVFLYLIITIIIITLMYYVVRYIRGNWYCRLTEIYVGIWQGGAFGQAWVCNITGDTYGAFLCHTKSLLILLFGLIYLITRIIYINNIIVRVLIGIIIITSFYYMYNYMVYGAGFNILITKGK